MAPIYGPVNGLLRNIHYSEVIMGTMASSNAENVSFDEVIKCSIHCNMCQMQWFVGRRLQYDVWRLMGLKKWDQ